MKTSYSLTLRRWSTAILAALCVFAFSASAYADRGRHRGHHKHSHSRYHRGHHHHHHPHYNRGYNRYIGRGYYGYPRSYSRSGFVITFGNGYAGRGYYYGPRGLPYYNRGPGVVFYRTRPAGW